jgi:hypothetical protein
MLELAHVLVGTALGVRCRIFALALATIASVTFNLGLGLLAGDEWTSVLVLAQLNVIALQVGYVVCGVVLSMMKLQ